jgi:hypothetical protein
VSQVVIYRHGNHNAIIVGSYNVMPFRNPLKHYDHANRNEGNLFETNTKKATTLLQQIQAIPIQLSPHHERMLTGYNDSIKNLKSSVSLHQFRVRSFCGMSFCILHFVSTQMMLSWMGLVLIKLLEETTIGKKCVEVFRKSTRR